MRLIMMGTGPFAVPAFEALFERADQVVGLVTRPPRAPGGRKPQCTNPMALAAAAHGAPVWMPESVNSLEFRDHLQTLRADLFVVCDFGEILSPETLARTRLGGINLHGSLLPKYRGAAPVAWAIYHGERETGVTVIQMSAGLDAGPCLVQAGTTIGQDETAAELELRLARLGAPLVCRAIDQLATGHIQPIPQDPSLATRAPRLKKTDGQIDWSRSATQIHNHVRAMQPWPAAYTFWYRRGADPLRIIVHAVAVDPAKSPAPGGTILEAGQRLLVATGQGTLQLVRVQPAGKRVLAADALLCGYPLRCGDRLGNQANGNTSAGGP